MIGLQSAFAIGNGLVTATIVGGVIPMLEPLFQITTDISWLEASDLNHPLLRRMTIEAPGTYHHSLVVANLAEAAAEAIGANATLCRVCAYFHDVGKLVKPGLFHREHELRAKSARGPGANHERVDHYCACERRGRSRAQIQTQPAASLTSFRNIMALHWFTISTNARSRCTKTRVLVARL